MEPDRYLVDLEGAIALMTEAVAGADPGASVPSCPGWTVTDLVDHLGCVHLWTAASVRNGAPPDPYPTREDEGRTLAQWYSDCGRELLETLSGFDPDDHTWTFNKADQTVGFWCRRQLHETTVHWADMLLITGASMPGPPELTREVAADGIDEVLTFFVPREQARARKKASSSPDRDITQGDPMPSAPETVLVICDDVPESRWLVTTTWSDGLPDCSTRAISPQERVTADGTVTANAITTYLALWNRVDRADLRAEGAAAERMLRSVNVP